MKNVTLGADPEVFFYDNKQYTYVSAIGKVGGSKLEPLFIDDYGHAVQEDNVAAEFNIPPVKTPEEFVKEINFMLSYLKEVAKKYDCSLGYATAVYFHDDQLTHPKALSFGCDPDINVWEMVEQKPPRLQGMDQKLRTCGGHIHIGWDNPQLEEQIELVRALDVFVGAPLAHAEGYSMRRKLYGKTGSCRIKPYGIEYRTPSNYWLRSDNTILDVAKKSLQAVEFIQKGNKVNRNDYSHLKTLIDDSGFDAFYTIKQKYGVTDLSH